MNDSKNEFRNQLIRLEQTNPALKEHYQKEMQNMYEKKIEGLRRWWWLGTAIFGITIAVGSVIFALNPPFPIPEILRWGCCISALFGIGWAFLGIKIFRRGSLNLKTDTGTAAALTWLFVVGMMVMFLTSAPDTIVGLRMILFGLTFLVMGAAMLLRHVIEQSELKNREKLLEIECRLAELSESLIHDKPSLQ